jgi:hypothetical protein
MRLSLPDDEPHPDDLPYLAAAGGWLLGWLILGWPWLSGRYTIPWDAKAQFQPQIQFLADSLARGESPFWNPFVFSGHPQAADPQSMIFSPPFLLLAALDAAPSSWAADTTLLVAILTAGLAIILWFRDRAWHPAGGLLAALAFGFGAAMAWRIQHTGQVLSLAYLPVTLILLERALVRSSWAYGVAAGLMGAFLVLGRDQVALLSVYLLAAYVLFELAREPAPLASLRRWLMPLAAGSITGLAVIAIPILLTASLGTQSNRPEIDFIGAGRGSLHPALGLTFFSPDLFGSSGRMWDYWGPPSFAWQGTGLFIAQNIGQFYIGAIPALLVLIGAGSGLLWRGEVRFFSLALAVMALYALGWYTPAFKLAHTYLPGVSLYRRPADAVFLIGYLTAILAGYTLHRLLSQLQDRHDVMRGALFAAAVTLAAFASAFALAIHMDRVAMATQPWLVSVAVFAIGAAILADALWFHPIRPIFAAGLIAAFTVADLAISNGPGSATALPPSRFDVLEPATRNETIAVLKRKTAEGASATRRDRVELTGLGFHWPNASITHRLENTMGYTPVRLGLYSRATGAEDSSGLPEQRRFSALFPSYRSQLADLLGLRYIATSIPLTELDPIADAGDFPIVATTPDGAVYENPRAYPRVLFATAAAPADFEAILATGVWPAADLHTTVLLEPAQVGAPSGGQGTARIVRYANTHVAVEVDSTLGGYAVLNDLWHPWWQATLDGVPAPLLRANVLFRAVRVPNGRHTVQFTFAPIRGAAGAFVSR